MQRIRQIVVDDAANCAVECRREKQNLALARETIKNAFNTRQESHISHAISLVENTYTHCSQVDVASLDEILEAPRSCYDD